MMPPLFLMLAAMAQTASAAAPYSAVGRDSSWSLSIEAGRLSFVEPGRPEVSVVARRTESEGSVEYRAGEYVVSTLPSPCETASGQRYAESVYVTIGRRELSGCGGAPLAADWLDGTSWHFAEIAGEAVPLTGDLLRDDRYAIDFGADGFMGYGGCNRFSAAYSRSGDTLTAHAPWGATVGRCSDPVMARERRLLQILTAPVRLSFPDRETLVLTGEAGTIRLRRTRQHR